MIKAIRKIHVKGRRLKEGNNNKREKDQEMIFRRWCSKWLLKEEQIKVRKSGQSLFIR